MSAHLLPIYRRSFLGNKMIPDIINHHFTRYWDKIGRFMALVSLIYRMFWIGPTVYFDLVSLFLFLRFSAGCEPLALCQHEDNKIYSVSTVRKLWHTNKLWLHMYLTLENCQKMDSRQSVWLKITSDTMIFSGFCDQIYLIATEKFRFSIWSTIGTVPMNDLTVIL